MTSIAFDSDSYADRAVRGMRYLGDVLELGPGFAASTADAVALLFGSWGHRTSRGIEESEKARRGAPFEYSLVLDADRVDVRIFFRPLAPNGATTARASWQQGWRTLETLEDRGVAELVHARTLRDLFQPRSDRAAFGLCTAVSVRPDGIGASKVYFDTMAAGIERNRDLVGEALDRLGHGPAWRWLQEHDPHGLAHLIPAFFSLDLHTSPRARVKFYTTVDERSTSALAARVGELSDTARSTAAAFVDSMSADSSQALAGPGVRPTLCWSMTSRSDAQPDDATLYLPFNRYAPDREDALSRLRKLLAPALYPKMENLVRATEVENPFHWAATKLNRTGSALTLYVAADIVEAASTAS
ncbi:tryptophan dimethylallyltransferase family protein [Streptomyces sp. NPDC093097]|uniref:tryptophan dimethylallyltransferase family protein n=1 Tax=Streptomyces sp. NPDC093097 TaxID=3366027 RepID=UPI0037FCDF04